MSQAMKASRAGLSTARPWSSSLPRQRRPADHRAGSRVDHRELVTGLHVPRWACC